MGFFSKKSDQESHKPEAEKGSGGGGDIHDYTVRLEAIVAPCVQAWQKLEHDNKHLVDIVRSARSQKVDVEGIDQFIEGALADVSRYLGMLKEAKAQYDALEFKPKYGDAARKERMEWDTFFSKQLTDIPLIIEALSPPDVLKMVTADGKNKQNAFLSGTGTLEYLKQLDVVSKHLAQTAD